MKLHNLLIAGCSLVTVLALAGCAGSEVADGSAEEESNVSALRTNTCSAVIDASTAHNVTLSVEGNVLTVAQSSRDARYAPEKYKLSPVNLFTAPIEAPRFSCEQETGKIAVWQSIARVQSGYYTLTRLENPGSPTGPSEPGTESPTSPSAPGNTCSAELDPTTGAGVTLTVEGRTLTVLRTAPNARYAPQRYTLSPVNLFAAPVEEPLYACASSSANITVWERYARVGSAYYTLRPTT
jgi:hypothetical protein